REMTPIDIKNPLQEPGKIMDTLGALIKNIDDMDLAKTKVNKWLDRKTIKTS
ncbi:hypothetical protein MHK_009225, partial [Candidatus Magnetomorum sp. HK-1]